MNILPKSTIPPMTAMGSSHFPEEKSTKGHYRTYSPCLRWEFGFTCAFCQLHENDFFSFSSKAKLYWIEHYRTQSRNPDLTNQYDNCIYCCQWCNESRGSKPSQTPDGKYLINPRREGLGKYFFANQDIFKVKQAEAKKTLESYRINDERKVTLRRERSTRISACVDSIGDIMKLREVARINKDIVSVQRCNLLLKRVCKELARYQAEPKTKPQDCFCNSQNSLPEFLVSQLIAIDSVCHKA